MEEDYQKALELIFAYGYECCAFKHNICGDQLKVPDGMPDSSNPLHQDFFVNLGCPPTPAATKAKTAKEDPSEAAKELEESASIGDLSLFLSPFFLSHFFLIGLIWHPEYICIIDAIVIFIKYDFWFIY